MKYGRITEDNKLEYFMPYKGGLKINGFIIINPTEEQYNNEGWYIVEDIVDDGELELVGNIIKNYIGKPFGKTDLELVIDNKIMEIEEYDVSDNVNQFFINNVGMWFSKAERSEFLAGLEAEELVGNTIYNLWYGDLKFELPIVSMKQMFASLIHYAKQCYDVTHEHMSNVKKLTSIEEIEKYDYTVGYPEKLRFEL